LYKGEGKRAVNEAAAALIAHYIEESVPPVALKIPSCLLVLGAEQGNRSAHRTLRAWEVDVLSKANYWEQNKKQRMAEFEDLQVGPAPVCVPVAMGRGCSICGTGAQGPILQSGVAGVELGMV
jgi:hypothetical protein